MVSEYLRDRILNLELEPGADIDELELVEIVGVSRTPVREAIIKLAAENLVVVQPNRGALVAPLNALDFPRLIEALDLSQRAVTQLAALRRKPKHIDAINQTRLRVERAIKEADPLEATLANRDFHVAIADSGDNRFLHDQYERQLNIALRYARLPLGSEPKGDTSVTLQAHQAMVIEHHRAILDAIVAKDPVKAGSLAHDHSNLFSNRMLEFFGENNLTDLMVIDGNG
jgi:DNA-binding GntR family transcriptional regulator